MEDYVAVVNGSPIRRFDLDNAIQGLAMELHRKTMDQLDETGMDEIRKMALEKLIARELIYQEALARGIVASEEAIAGELDKIVANFPGEEEFFATIGKAGIDAATYHRMLRQDLSVNLMTEKQLEEVPEPTGEQIAETYRKHPERMKRAARVRASHILVRVPEDKRREAEARIEEIRKMASPVDFAELARKHSDCPSAPAGGDLGYFRRGEMARSFEEAAFAQEVGEVGPVVETQFGLHLIKVTDREEEVPLTLEEATPRIREFLKAEAGAERVRKWVEKLRSAARIEVKP